MAQRSVFVTVVGCVFIALSGLFLLQALAFLFLPLDKLLPLTQPIQLFSPGDTLYLSFARGMFLVLGAVSAWVLLSAIGLVMRKNWARVSFLIIASLGLVFSLLYLVMGLADLSAGGAAGQTPDLAPLSHALMRAMVVLGAVFAGVYGGVLYKLSNAKIKAEFLPSPKN